MNPRRIPAFIVTGFLGAGKTTLLRSLIQGTTGLRFAVIVNEFGEIGFDGEAIATCCDDVVELRNGCICCRVGDDLVPTLEAAVTSATPPDAILIETSGLALPQPVVDAFAFPTLARHTQVAGVIVVADAAVLATGTFDDVLAWLKAPPSLGNRRASVLHGGTDGQDDPIAEVFEDQLRAADLVVLSKADLLPSAVADQLHQDLAQALPAEVALVRGSIGRFDPGPLLALHDQDHVPKPSRHALEGEAHDHDDFEGLVLDLGEITDRTAFEDRVARAVHQFKLLRVKGFVALQGRDQRLELQSTPSATTTRPDRHWQSHERRATQLVAIGAKGLPYAQILGAFKGEAH